ncbi:uncharacterized protein LOC142803030 [Rhipicephalus microplus]|uniref:uncharacterized protein LOC142803030 n=1 Tax=Rhipicephalus microplus TaxID=6941 RepID=UPI003F6D2A19
MVIWYDAVTRTGKCARQSELNRKSIPFFDLCDGIFLHFKWTEDMLEDSAKLAGDRKKDVYVGIDVFARKTQYAGGFETYKAVAEALKYGLSAGIFAAGWVYQTQNWDKFAKKPVPASTDILAESTIMAKKRKWKHGKFWKFPDKLCNDWRIATLPLTTSFCQGFGERLYKDGKVVSQRPWYNLAKQQLQPRDQGTALCGGCGSATVDSTIAYNGGGCLRLQFDPKKDGVEPYFRLFGCDLLLGALRVTYAMQQRGADHVGCDVAIVLMVCPADDETEKIRLGLNVTVPDEQRYAVARDHAYSLAQHTSESGWAFRRYTIRDLFGDAKLQEIGAELESSTTAICCLLGQIEVERPSNVKENVEKDIDDGPDIASDDDDWEPSAKMMRL